MLTKRLSLHLEDNARLPVMLRIQTLTGIRVPLATPGVPTVLPSRGPGRRAQEGRGQRPPQGLPQGQLPRTLVPSLTHSSEATAFLAEAGGFSLLGLEGDLIRVSPSTITTWPQETEERQTSVTAGTSAFPPEAQQRIWGLSDGSVDRTLDSSVLVQENSTDGRESVQKHTLSQITDRVNGTKWTLKTTGGKGLHKKWWW